MKNISNLPLVLSEISEKVNGVFRRSDLANLFSTSSNDTLSKRIQFLIREGHLKRAIQGFYYTPDAKIMDLAQRIFPDGYFSLTTGLSLNIMIGTRPTRKITIVTARPRPKTFHFDIGSVQMKRINSEYFFGFSKIGYHRIATPEKAFIDSCYYYLKKETFPFDLSSDVRVDHLDIALLKEMLKKYANKRFVQFTLNMVEENGRKIR
ncbi:MAG: hypothetical protein HQL32_15075 [Planctomycetes bacterium]|nr:hypothetical protein [Planctomycetota bacterium]